MLNQFTNNDEPSMRFWVDDQEYEVSIRLVTPEMAQEILDLYNVGNRALSDANVHQLQTDMEEGLFVFNGDAIRFDRTPRLLDGQNRLTAIVQSNTEQICMVVEGLDPDVMPTIDGVKVRTVKDILTIGVNPPVYSNLSVLVASANIIMAGQKETFPYAKDKKRVAKYVEEHKDELEPGFVAWAKSVSEASPPVDIHSYSDKRRCLSPSPLAALVWVMTKQGADPQEVRSFFEKIAGIAFVPEEEFDSIRAITSWLQGHPLIREGGTQFPRMMRVYATLIVAFNRISSGVPVKTLKPLLGGDTGYRYFDHLPRFDLIPRTASRALEREGEAC